MNQLSNKQRIIVFFIGFFLGCAVLSVLHEQRRAAREVDQEVLASGVPGVIRFYADMGVPLEGPFVLEAGEPRRLDGGNFVRVVIIGSRDQTERFRIEEIFSGQLGTSAQLLHWRVSDPDHVWARLGPNADRTSLVADAADKGYVFLRFDRDKQAYFVGLPDGGTNAVEQAIEELERLEGIDVVEAMVLDQSDKFPSLR